MYPPHVAGPECSTGSEHPRCLCSRDVIASEHWGSSGFANTDLDLQLKRHGIQKLIVMGLIAHTCVEATVRYAAELGYEVTMVKDATASYSEEHMHAVLTDSIQ